MKKLAGLLIVFLSFVGISAAQRHGGGRPQGQPHQRQEQPRYRPDVRQRDQRPNQDWRNHRNYEQRERHYEQRERQWRGHYDGHHFDRWYHERYFGPRHVFIVNRPVFIGGHYRFYYGNNWFMWYDPWPVSWCYCDQVWIEYDPIGDCYWMYNAAHPGIRIHIGIAF